MKKLNWALRLCKPEHISFNNCYYKRGYCQRDWFCYINSGTL